MSRQGEGCLFARVKPSHKLRSRRSLVIALLVALAACIRLKQGGTGAAMSITFKRDLITNSFVKLVGIPFQNEALGLLDGADCPVDRYAAEVLRLLEGADCPVNIRIRNCLNGPPTPLSHCLPGRSDHESKHQEETHLGLRAAFLSTNACFDRLVWF